MFGGSLGQCWSDSFPAQHVLRQALGQVGTGRQGMVPKGEVETWLGEGQERKVFALPLEELVGFLPLGSVNHKTRGGWDWDPESSRKYGQ